MRVRGILFTLSLVLFTPSFASAEAKASQLMKPPFNLVEELAGKGVVMEIHAAVPEFHQYVATLRKGSFFEADQFPLVADGPNVANDFLKLRRHDRVRIKGTLVNPKNPQRHIRVSRIDILHAYEVELPPYHYNVDIPQELGKGGTLKALVHAVVGDGHVMLIDFKGVIIPVVVTRPDLTKNLFRNDSIQLAYVVRGFPAKPSHMMMDPQAKVPLKVLYSIQSEHDKQGLRIGPLEMFPKSPQIAFNVFAIEATNSLGLMHNYTLIATDKEKFRIIREYLQDLWDKAPKDQVRNARNRLLNPRIIVKVRGKFNVVDPGQANPQIVIDSPKDLEIEIR